MISFFLRSRHWQIFILIFGFPLILQFVFMGYMISGFADGINSDSKDVFSFLRFFPLLMIVFIGGFFLWLWSIVEGLKTKAPINSNLNFKKFKIFFFIPLIYCLILFILLNTFFGNDFSLTPNMLGTMVAIIVPLHFLSLFSILHTMFFVAKTIKTIEYNRAVVFGDFLVEFFLVWFYPVGIWILQPKINELEKRDI